MSTNHRIPQVISIDESTEIPQITELKMLYKNAHREGRISGSCWLEVLPFTKEGDSRRPQFR
jgi:hypothetical protein